jgi:hypothetical protein
MKDPKRLGCQNLLDQVVCDLRCIVSLRINKKMESLLNVKCMNYYANIELMLSHGQDKCLSLCLNLTHVSLPCSLAK